MKFVTWNKDEAATYYRCFIPSNNLTPTYSEARGWCRNNCVGKVMIPYQNGHWLFELEEDAVAFKLRWL